MTRNTVCQGQSFLDKVIETTGSIDNAFAMSVLNQLSVTEVLEIGREIVPAAVTKKQVVSLFDEQNRPATLFVETDEEENYEFPQGEFAISF